MNKTTNIFRNRHFLNIFIPWSCAFLLLFLYYYFIEFPMERSFMQGLEHLRQNKPAAASGEFRKVLRVFPEYEPVYLNIAHFSLKKGLPKKSKFQYNYARRLCLINSEIFSARGLVYAHYNYGRLGEGVAFYNDHVIKNYSSNLFKSHEKK